MGLPNATASLHCLEDPLLEQRHTDQERSYTATASGTGGAGRHEASTRSRSGEGRRALVPPVLARSHGREAGGLAGAAHNRPPRGKVAFVE